MHKVTQYSLIFITLVVFISGIAVQETFAQTKLYDLYPGSVSVAFSPNGQYIATGDTDGYLRLWEVSSGENIYYRSLGGEVAGVAFSPDGRYIAADGVGGSVRAVLLEASTGGEVLRADLADAANAIHSVAFSSNERYVAVGDNIGYAYLLDVNDGSWTAWTYSQDELYAVAFSPNGEYLVTGDSDGYARLWEVSTWWGDADDLNVQSVELGGNVKAVAFSPNGKYLAADGYDGNDSNVTIYDVVSDRVVQHIELGNNHPNVLTFSPDGQYLAVGGTDPEIIIYRIGTEEITLTTQITEEKTIQVTSEVRDLAWNPDGDLISDGRAVYRTLLPSWDDSLGIRLTLPEDFISEVAFGPNTTYFIWNVQFPKFIGVAETDVIYRDCTITLDLEGVPDNSLSDRLFSNLLEYIRQAEKRILPINPTLFMAKEFAINSGILDVFPDEPQYFMFPLKTAAERSSDVEKEANESLLIAAGTHLVGLIPLAGDLLSLGITFGSIEYKRVLAIDEILRSIMDPQIRLTNSTYDPGRPNDQLKFVLILPKRVTTVKIKVEQQYSLESEVSDRIPRRNTPTYTATREGTWDLEYGTFAAPRAQPIALADYPPFQLLPPEIQDSLLRHFSTVVNSKELLIPEETSLLPNYPNPFNPETWIPYQLAEPADVTVTIYAVDGKVVRTLALGHQPVGIYQGKNRAAHWDGKNALGESVTSGVYFYTLKAGDFTVTRKMLIRK